ncbi:hypothetical protein V8G69_12860 [Gaetbulibacter sp. M235]|uniref:hypothetical protein n=1 Tax=Gaetbulibacter sp. M235 TaxID=3126510 RepID=UPI00374E99BC
MKNLQKLGKALNKAEQKGIIGGIDPKRCVYDSDCEYDDICNSQTGQCTVW